MYPFLIILYLIDGRTTYNLLHWTDCRTTHQSVDVDSVAKFSVHPVLLIYRRVLTIFKSYQNPKPLYFVALEQDSENNGEV